LITQLKQLLNPTNTWSGKVKYKVIADYPTTEGVLYRGEIVTEHVNKPNHTKSGHVKGHIRVKDSMGRIWFVNENILKKIA